MIPTIYLTAPDVKGTEQRTYRYFVELISEEGDEEGTQRSRIFDLLLLENTEGAIKAAIARAGHLKGWRKRKYIL